MEVSFADPQLELIETHRAAETSLPFAVISTARARLSIIRASPDLVTLRQWRSFGLAPNAELPGQHSVPITDKWLMTVRFDNLEGPRTVVIAIKKIEPSGEVL
ncbi:hypothetical protein [Sphingomonas endolithica]|uniref:hypothetical protein n=1 Tax=Sphingomonas endolithica TaxID=2972485 RepID=UPI0021AE3CDD|nr:hypothetical protein [Sphingomonas sp. ZFBP2030]